MKMILCMGFSFLLAGCATGPGLKLAGVKEGQWHGKALIKDKEQSRSYIVNLSFNAVRDERARMDVTSTLGTGVASLVVDNKEVRYVLLDSKRFYFGRPQPDVMRPILAMPFDPRWLHNLLFEEPLPEKTWTCTRDSAGDLLNCRDEATQTEVTWSDRRGDHKTVLIEHPKASVQIKITSFKPKVEDRKNLFVLEAPEGFQKLRVR
jgi:hypothetical protein